MQWLRMIKDYIAGSFHVEKDDFELDPFNKQGGLSRFYQLFTTDYEKNTGRIKRSTRGVVKKHFYVTNDSAYGIFVVSLTCTANHY